MDKERLRKERLRIENSNDVEVVNRDDPIWPFSYWRRGMGFYVTDSESDAVEKCIKYLDKDK